jgi:squalene-hopene/tetraprenyl-beta-curcumene cyclase
MLDPPCADITGRVLEMLGRFPALKRDPEVARSIQLGVEFLKAHQERDGSWYGRWGVNYIYGTWQALKGLMAVGVSPEAPFVRRAVEWLLRVQRPDGGWGETCETYSNPALKGQGPSTAAQTAWAVMGLAAAGEVESAAVQRGIEWLLAHQSADGAWEDSEYTGTGFPTVFYLKYHLYQVYFPLFALGYYRNLVRGTHPRKLRTGVPLPGRRRQAPQGSLLEPALS